MTLTKEINEILDYLNNKNSYALFAGFSAFLQTKVKASNDIDIFVPSIKEVEQICEDFIQKSWKLKKKLTDNKRFMIATVEKNKTTLDILFSQSAKETYLPSKIKVRFGKYSLYSISPEALFLTKMSALTNAKRIKGKTKRDRKVIKILRTKLNVRKLKKLVQTTKDVFWTKGYF